MNQVRWKRRIAESPLCPLCHEEKKSNLHALRDCPEARKIWNCFVPPKSFREFLSLRLQEWLLWNFSTKRMRDFSEWWSTQFAVICWWIWRWRNELVFNGEEFDVARKTDHINATIMEMIDA